MLPDHHLEKVIDFTEQGDIPTSFTWYKLGIAVLGPTNQIRHYKKCGTWSMDWTIDPPEKLNKILSRLENLIGVTKRHDILQILQNDFKFVKRNESGFNDFCLIYPTGQYVMALCHNNTLNLYRVSTGDPISTLTLDGHAVVIKENPKFPYAAIGFEGGIVKLISAYNPEKLVRLTQFYLCKNSIDSIYFNECGTIFVAANLTTGRFFIIEGLPGGQMEIIATVDAQQQIAHYMMVLSENCYRIFSIPVTSDKYIAGNRIIRYCVIKDKGIDIKEYNFEENNTLYIRIYATTGINRDRIFYTIPREGKTINEIEIRRGDNLAMVTRKIITGHQMRQLHLKRNKNIALTWASDGFVILRSSDFTGNVGIALPHHRMEGGVKTAYVDPYVKFILSIGRDKVLVCTNLTEKEIDNELKKELEGLLNSPNYTLIFKKRTVGFMPKGEYEGKCYLEVEELKKIEQERIKCKVERTAIVKEFKSIQEELQHLLTENIEGPDNEKLNLMEFNLNIKLYEQKAEHHKKVCKATEIYLKHLIEAQNQISQFMLDNFWAKMRIPGTAIKAIFAHFEVWNYVLLPKNVETEEILKWIRHQRRIERYLSEMNSFHPWVPMPEEKVLELVSARPCIPKKDEEMAALSTLEADAPIIEEAEEDPETKISFSGSDLARFIEVQDAHYLQHELQTYFQTELQWIISKNDSYKLKEYFNSKFDAIMTQKLKEMGNIKEKNARLSHIVSEINYFSEEKISVKIEDPHWEQTETPQLLTEVKDEEVPITPYISPSEQAILDAKAAEAERLRLLLLADDFRERALMAMMNGVLEVRWEDELKKDVPLPKCMIEKDPENFNEDDLRAVRDYEEKVKFLSNERERYKTMLRAEYGKLSNTVREHIRKFNGKLSDLLNLKLQVDSAISQETFKINRMKLFQHSRMILIKREFETLQRIADNEKVVSSLQELLNSLHEAVVECKNYVEVFQIKDKFLEKGFKKDFQDMSPLVQEQASKLYKKRPRINIRSISSTSILNELAKCIMSSAKPTPTVSQDCIEFLKSLDSLDLYVGVPSIVDEHTYALICRHRRLRIEYEIKLRAAQCEVTEGEVTLAAFHRRLTQKKEVGVKLTEELNKVRSDFISTVRNREIQIVLPKGLVEIPLTGSFEDFEDAALICRKDVENINQIILKFGEKKIKAMQQGMGFRRKILAMEWEHKRMKMLIQDLKEKLVDIDGVRLTKEIQAYLKSKDKEKTIPFETEVDMIKASYENTIQDRKDKVNRMKKQVSAIKERDKIIDQKIEELNVDVCEFNLMKDQEIDDKERTIIDSRMKTLLKRSRLVQQIQENHHEILMLQTELELLRLKTFPTLKYKICN
ncbi:WD repeat-containing protein 96 [Asbolus verrucosus]|uniref:Cilia- and flagella-associated protein 43 n=1 Tax=Asbolus verrucosus TaxID=1661398 RepID=A0A482VAY7_ASBVE|nr:WD repeat-containing protein 96 [Asbolus verrucosus]